MPGLFVTALNGHCKKPAYGRLGPERDARSATEENTYPEPKNSNYPADDGILESIMIKVLGR